MESPDVDAYVGNATMGGWMESRYLDAYGVATPPACRCGEAEEFTG
jgi:hypothetical protein